jgi:DNA polymerase/3'-5' exonuclease PolX
MQLWEKLLTREIHKLDKNIIVHIVGSYRRGLAQSSDIDILLTQPKTSSKAKEEYTVLERVVEAFKQAGYITDTLGSGKKKFMGVVQLVGIFTLKLLICSLIVLMNLNPICIDDWIFDLYVRINFIQHYYTIQ